jgi:hypothetical protein
MSRHRNKAAQSLVAEHEWPVTSDIRVPIVSDCLGKMQVAAQQAAGADRANAPQFRDSFPFVAFVQRARRISRRPLGEPRTC